jgi:hypothetical protein
MNKQQKEKLKEFDQKFGKVLTANLNRNVKAENQKPQKNDKKTTS